MRHLLTRAISASALLLALVSGTASAQSEQVRVLRDRAVIWRADAPMSLATTVSAGTLLDVVGRRDTWYVVVMPPGNAGKGEFGLIAASLVEATSGASAPPSRPPSRGPTGRSAPPARPQARAVPLARPEVEVVGFGHVGYGTWLAHDTFSAVFGNAQALMYGGGLQVRYHALFAEGALSYFQKTGSRVFVSNGTVYSLGIPDTVRVLPLTATAGIRRAGRSISPYAGGGIGVVFYKETSEFADASENISEHPLSYHAVGGVEFASRPGWSVAVEAQYTTVPNALGSSGASAVFDETNLGGVQIRIKILAGAR